MEAQTVGNAVRKPRPRNVKHLFQAVGLWLDQLCLMSEFIYFWIYIFGYITFQWVSLWWKAHAFYFFVETLSVQHLKLNINLPYWLINWLINQSIDLATHKLLGPAKLLQGTFPYNFEGKAQWVFIMPRWWNEAQKFWMLHQSTLLTARQAMPRFTITLNSPILFATLDLCP